MDLYILAAIFLAAACQTTTATTTTTKTTTKTKTSSSSSPSSKPVSSHLWRINTKHPHPSFLFGTAHASYDQLWENVIPSNAKQALWASDSVQLEQDLTRVSLSYDLLHQCGRLPEGQTLEDVLEPDLFEDLREHLTEMKLFALCERSTLGLVYSLAQRTEYSLDLGKYARDLTEYGVRNQAVSADSVPLDAYLGLIAKFLKKRVGSLETFKEHCDMFREPKGIEKALKLLLKCSPTYHGGLVQYLRGENSSKLFTVDEKEKKRCSAKEVAWLETWADKGMRRRNKRMAKRAARLMEESPESSFFLAVGYMHLPGLIELLREAGYDIDKVDPDEDLGGLEEGSSGIGAPSWFLKGAAKDGGVGPMEKFLKKHQRDVIDHHRAQMMT